MLKEFKEFAMRGNVVDLAIGVIIGAAFGKIVTSLVNDVIMPPIGLLMGNVDFSNLFVNLTMGATYGSVADLKAANLLSNTERSERGAYRITISVANTATYTATATPVNDGAFDMTEDAQCTSFSITAQGLRTATGNNPTGCW